MGTIPFSEIDERDGVKMNKKTLITVIIIGLILVASVTPAQAGFVDWFKGILGLGSAEELTKQFDSETNTLSILYNKNPQISLRLVSKTSDICTFEEIFELKSYVDYTFDDLKDFKVRWKKHKGRNNIDHVDWLIERPYNISVNDYGLIEKSQIIPNIIRYENVTDTWDCSMEESCRVGDCDSLEQWNITRQTVDGTESGIVCFDLYEVLQKDPLKIKVFWSERGVIGSHEETRYHWVKFNPVGKSIKNGETYKIKVVYHKKAELGSFAIQTIPMLAGFEEPRLTWWNGSWDYKKKINITGQSGAGTHYQVNFSIGNDSNAVGEDFDLEGHCNESFWDIRFVDDDEVTSLPYWIESVSDSGTGKLAKVWVNVSDNLNTSVDIYVYYGKSGESSASNGTNTFEFFDDFEDDIWTDVGEGIYVDTPNSRLYFKCDRAATADLTYVAKSMGTSNWELFIDSFKFTGYSTASYHDAIGAVGLFENAETLHEADINNHDAVEAQIRRGCAEGGEGYSLEPEVCVDGTVSSGTSYNNMAQDTQYQLAIRKVGNTLYLIIYDSNGNQLSSQSVGYSGTANLNYIVVSNLNDNTGTDWVSGLIDNLHLRKYHSPEPAFSSVGAEETSAPTITLLNQTPSLLYENSTGNFNVTYQIYHPVTLNNTSISFIYTNYDTDLGSYNHSLRVPSNNRSAFYDAIGEYILRADNRNGTLHFESNDTITGGDIYSWGGGDNTSARMHVERVNDTYTLVHWNGTIQDTVTNQMWYLDRTDLQNAAKTEYPIYKNHGLLTKIWDIGSIQNHNGYIINLWVDSHLGALPPNKPIEVWYLNSSFDPTSSINPVDSPYASYITSHNATSWVDHKYTPRNCSYVNAFYINQSNVEASGINVTDTGWIFFTSEVASSKPYYMNITNAHSTTNMSFADTKVMYSYDGSAPLTLESYTPNVFVEFKHDYHQFQMKLFAADTNDSWGNSTLNTTNIGDVYYDPTIPVVNHFWYGSQKDYDMNKTYGGVFDIVCGVATDPDGGDVTHNLSLWYGNRTFVATINNTFKDSGASGGLINISFDPTSYLSSIDNYTLKLVATDDEGKTSESWLGVNFSLYGTQANDTSFTVTLPTGYTYAHFQPPNSIAKNYSCDGQNLTTPFYNITNTGNVNFDVRMKLNATVADIILRADTDNNPSGSSIIGTTLVTLYSTLTPANSVDIWMWSDFNHAVPQVTNRTLSINVTQ